MTSIARIRAMKAGDARDMATTLETTWVTETTTLSGLLDDAARETVTLERDGQRFRLSREEAIDYEPDPELARRTLAATAGSWADLDIDRVIGEIHEARQAGSRPPDRP